jgi:hypothetical protein
MLQLAPSRGRGQKGSDNAEPKMSPALVRSEALMFFFHWDAVFLIFSTTSVVRVGFDAAPRPASAGIRVGFEAVA